MKHGVSSLLLLLLLAAPANARTICTLIADAGSGHVLLEQGDCRSRVTPASTFKIALSLMGFDSGFLTGPGAPVLPFQQGYPDWGGKNWTQPTDPARWMKYSVLWYSYHITAALGAGGLPRYVEAFDYGNADVSGDSGKNNALKRAWISSSLRISPLEQVAFLRKLLDRALPVSPQAMEQTLAIIEKTVTDDDWTVSGKTGAAYPRQADGRFDRSSSWGWYVGWANKGDRTLIFARLEQEEKRQKGSAGIRAKNAFIKQWPELIAAIR